MQICQEVDSFVLVGSFCRLYCSAMIGFGLSTLKGLQGTLPSEQAAATVEVDRFVVHAPIAGMAVALVSKEDDLEKMLHLQEDVEALPQAWGALGALGPEKPSAHRSSQTDCGDLQQVALPVFCALLRYS